MKEGKEKRIKKRKEDYNKIIIKSENRGGYTCFSNKMFKIDLITKKYR